MKLSLRQLRAMQDARVARAFELEERGYRAHAGRIWATVERLTRAVEARRPGAGEPGRVLSLLDLLERLRGFRHHAEVHAMRGNWAAVREAHEDARRLIATQLVVAAPTREVA